MFLNIAKAPRKNNRKRCVRYKAKMKAKNRRRRGSLTRPRPSSHAAR